MLSSMQHSIDLFRGRGNGLLVDDIEKKLYTSDMLKELILSDFGTKEQGDYSCSEKMLYGSNQVYNLGLDQEHMKMAAGLSGGLFTGKLCGALSGAVMVLSRMYVSDRAHASEDAHAGELVEEFVTKFEQALGITGCTALKEKYRTEEDGCKYIVAKAAELLDGIIDREGK